MKLISRNTDEVNKEDILSLTVTNLLENDLIYCWQGKPKPNRKRGVVK
jgi:hypothetical protein